MTKMAPETEQVEIRLQKRNLVRVVEQPKINKLWVFETRKLIEGRTPFCGIVIGLPAEEYNERLLEEEIQKRAPVMGDAYSKGSRDEFISNNRNVGYYVMKKVKRRIGKGAKPNRMIEVEEPVKAIFTSINYYYVPELNQD